MGTLVGDGVACPECSGTDLEWGYVLTGPPGVSQGRHHTGELEVVVYLGCSQCSHTLHRGPLGELLGNLPHVETMLHTREKLLQLRQAALREIRGILASHPTNVGVGEPPDWRPLNPGEAGYDHRARYAYLVAEEALRGEADRPAPTPTPVVGVGTQVLVWDVAMLELGYDSPVLGTILVFNGDQVDVADPDGEVDCFPLEWCWAQVAAEPA